MVPQVVPTEEQGTVACRKLMKNTGQTSPSSGAHSNDTFSVSPSYTTPGKIEISHKILAVNSLS